ncbi:MAG: type II toxin-antitoxin system RelE/ParE family toxin [Candidatus Micrarchaeota archaeon]
MIELALVVLETEFFERDVKKLDASVKRELRQTVSKIIDDPKKGKPLKHFKNVFSERMRNFRIIYRFVESRNELLLVCFRNRDEVYDFLKTIRPSL